MTVSEVADTRTTSSPRTASRVSSKRIRRALLGWLYVIPALAAYGFVVIVPTGESLWYSLFDWNGVTTATWVGLGNYVDFVTDPLIGQALAHTLVLVFYYSILPIALGLLSAALVSRAKTRGSGFFRSVIFLPQILTSVVIAVIWRELFSSDGSVNAALQGLGLGSLIQPWLGSFTFSLPVLGLAGTWTTMGLCMLLFVAGVGNISTELYDAARVDGAGAVREFFAVTLPGLVPQIAVALTLTLVGALRAFDLIWLTTKGGPGTTTVTPAILLYSKSFTEQDVGGGAAIGVALAIASLIVALVIVRITDRRLLMIGRYERTLNYVVLSIFAAIVVVPLVLLVLTSLSPKPSGEPILSDLRWDNFVTAWNASDFGSHLIISAVVSLTVVVVAIIITPLAAYAIGILKIPGHRFLFVLFLAGIMIPLEGVIVPLYFTLRATPFASTLVALLIAHSGLSVSFGVFWMRAAFRAIPVSLLESARIDGAGPFRILRSIALPLTNPSIITLGLLTFMWTWNDFFLAFVLINNPEQLPVTVALGQFATKYTNQINLMSAAAILVALPIVVIYIVFQRRFIEGVLSGALKG